jgi:hypothetical protein
MTDLTGIARPELVGRKYEGILLEWIPSLSDEYRTESLKFISTPLEPPMEEITFEPYSLKKPVESFITIK